MGPKPRQCAAEPDLLRVELVNLIDQRHELVKLASLIDWPAFEQAWVPRFESTTGRPALPTRLMASFLYLKHSFALSDEDVVGRWIENPYRQHFSGEHCFRHELPCDPSSLVRWRQRMGAEGCEWLLEHSIKAAMSAGMVKRQSYARVGRTADAQADRSTHAQPWRYTHPRGMRRLGACARTPYEFGVKTSVAVTAKEGVVVGMRSMPGSPYDGDTLNSQLPQVETLSGVKPTMALAERGYRGVVPPEGTQLLISHPRGLPLALKKLLKRRQAVEPSIGHMKTNRLLARSWLKGSDGDAIPVVLRGAGHKLRLTLAHLRVLLLAFIALIVLGQIGGSPPRLTFTTTA